MVKLKVFLAINDEKKECYYVPSNMSRGVKPPSIPNIRLLGPYASKAEAKKHISDGVKLRN
jgi:hypothetical protein